MKTNSNRSTSFARNNNTYLTIDAIFCNDTNAANTTRATIKVHRMPNG